MALLVDSTVHIQWGRGFAPIPEWLDAHEADGLVTSAVSVAEIYSGVPPEQSERWAAYFQRFQVAGVDHGIAVFAGEMRFRLARGGFQLHFADSLIAATGILNDWPVATSNVKDFAITGVQLVAVGVEV